MTVKFFRLLSSLILMTQVGCAAAPLPATAPPASVTPRATAPATVPAATPTATFTPMASATPAPTLRPTATRRVPTASPTLPACLQAGGRIETGSLETTLLRLPLQFRVYLPPCYDEQPERRYPVLYLFHGQSYNDDQWDRMGADETADRLIASGEAAPFMIVMPFERYGGEPPDTGFSRAMVEVLLPHIDSAYRSLPERRYRAAGGLSRGAGWAVNMVFTHSVYFGALGAHSSAVFHSDAQRMRTWLKEMPPETLPRIYIDIGERDRPEILRSTLWFVDLLNEFNVPHEWHLFTGYHNEAYWSSHMEQYLRWYTEPW